MTSTRVTGMLYVGVSTIFFSLAAVAVKLSSIPAIEVCLIRSIYSIIVGIFLTTAVYGQKPLPVGGKPLILGLLMLRALADVIASNLFYFGCTQLGLGLATVILFTNPFWAGIIAKFWLGEPYGVSDFLLACFAFSGVVCSALPALQDASVSFAMVLLVFPCSVLQAWTLCLIRRIAGEVHFMQQTVAYGICGLVVGSSIMGYGVEAGQPLAEPAPWNVLKSTSVTLLNLLVAACAIGAQVFLNLGCAKIEATVAALIRTMNIPLALIFQYLVFGKAAKALEILGACIVLTACVALTAMKEVTASKKDDKELDPFA